MHQLSPTDAMPMFDGNAGTKDRFSVKVPDAGALDRS